MDDLGEWDSRKIPARRRANLPRARLASPVARTRQPGMPSSRPRGSRSATRSRGHPRRRVPVEPDTSLSSSDARNVFSFGPVKGDCWNRGYVSVFVFFFFFYGRYRHFETRFVRVRCVQGRRDLLAFGTVTLSSRTLTVWDASGSDLCLPGRSAGILLEYEYRRPLPP